MASHTAAGGHVVAGGIPGESAIIPTRTSSCSASSAPKNRISESRVGKIPTTLVRRLIYLCRRSSGFVECNLRRCSRGKCR
jgi:hypothetical protein